MSKDVGKQIVSCITTCKYFSLAIDKSCDVIDAFQLCVYVRCIKKQFHTAEKLFDLHQLVLTREDNVFKQ